MSRALVVVNPHEPGLAGGCVLRTPVTLRIQVITAGPPSDAHRRLAASLSLDSDHGRQVRLLGGGEAPLLLLGTGEEAHPDHDLDDRRRPERHAAIAVGVDLAGGRVDEGEPGRAGAAGGVAARLGQSLGQGVDDLLEAAAPAGSAHRGDGDDGVGGGTGGRAGEAAHRRRRRRRRRGSPASSRRPTGGGHAGDGVAGRPPAAAPRNRPSPKANTPPSAARASSRRRTGWRPCPRSAG